MICVLLRSKSSVELSSTIPPKIVLNLSKSIKEFKLEGSKTIGDFFSEIRKEEPVKNLQISVNNEVLPEQTLISTITKQEFLLNINKQSIHVLPGLALFIRGNEKFYEECSKFGVPFNEARPISRFLEVVDKQLPEEFSNSDLQKAILKAKSVVSNFKQEEKTVLKSQLQSFYDVLTPLEENLKNIEKKAEKRANNVIKLGLGVMISQWAGIGYGTFVAFGWDVMEPFSYMVGSTWAVIGFTYFFRQRQEFYPPSFKEIIYKRKFEKLLRKNNVSIERIELLKKNIQMIEKEIQTLE